MATSRPNRPRPPPRDPRADELYRQKQTLTDYFSELRTGFRHSYDVQRRASIINNTLHPKHGRWRGLQDPFTGPGRAPRIHRDRAVFPGGMPDSPGLLSARAQAQMAQAYSTTFNLSQNFTPANVSFQKILGYGGFGVAALFTLQDVTGRECRLVVKADLRADPGDTIQNEKNNMVLMAGAKHVVQRMLLAALPTPGDIPQPISVRLKALPGATTRFIIKFLILLLRVTWLLLISVAQVSTWLLAKLIRLLQGGNNAAGAANPGPANNQDPPPAPAQPVAVQPGPPQGPLPDLESWNILNLWPVWPAGPPEIEGIDEAIRRNRRQLDDRRDIIAMEFLKFGDLGKWIGKMTNMNITRRTDNFSEKVAWIIFECLWRGCVAMAHPGGFYQGMDPSTTQIPLVTETSQRSTVDSGNPMVHFDLDPQNIFIGNFAADHDLWPVTKVADLGLSVLPNTEIFQDDIDEESTRWRRRNRGKLDSLMPEQTTEEWDYVPNLNALRVQEVAGNYSSHSNIFHIGLAMFELITLHYPDDPNIPRPYNFRLGGRDMSGWTYGHNLLEENNPELAGNFSAELRHTVALCMEYNPLKRPRLDQLGRFVEYYSTQDFPNESDQDTRTWVRDFLGVPHATSPHSP